MAVRSGVPPGAVMSGVIPPPKTTHLLPLHAPEDSVHKYSLDHIKDPLRVNTDSQEPRTVQLYMHTVRVPVTWIIVR